MILHLIVVGDAADAAVEEQQPVALVRSQGIQQSNFGGLLKEFSRDPLMYLVRPQVTRLI